MLRFTFILSISLCLFLFSCGGPGSNAGNALPKDLNFSSVKTPEAYCDMVIYSLTTTRSNITKTQFSESSDIDASALKVMTDSYAQAIKKGDWIKEVDDIKEIGNNHIKVYKWLDKRRRVAMRLTVDVELEDETLKLDKLDFFSNLEILGSQSFQ